jgi:septum formation protein
MVRSRILILASASPARLRLLRDAGFAPEVAVSGIDESVFDDLPVVDRVAALAAAKADAVVASRAEADALVIGCDSLFELDGVAYGKPSGAAEAIDRIRSMRGRSGCLHTGHCVVDTATGARAVATASTTVHFAAMSDAEIDAYVATGEPLAVAGSFTLDGRAAVFVEGIDGDPSNVIGLSLPLFRRLLAELGVEVTSLWT